MSIVLLDLKSIQRKPKWNVDQFFERLEISERFQIVTVFRLHDRWNRVESDAVTNETASVWAVPRQYFRGIFKNGGKS